MLLGVIAAVDDICSKDMANIWQFVGYVLYVFKIAIPLLLIIFGMIDLGKAVIASDDKEIKNATTKLVKRAIAAVVIFFIPYLVSFIFSIVGGFADVESTYEKCRDCILYPKTCKTGQEQKSDDDANQQTEN